MTHADLAFRESPLCNGGIPYDDVAIWEIPLCNVGGPMMMMWHLGGSIMQWGMTHNAMGEEPTYPECIVGGSSRKIC